jgi:hypothetical protein
MGSTCFFPEGTMDRLLTEYDLPHISQVACLKGVLNAFVFISDATGNIK